MTKVKGGMGEAIAHVSTPFWCPHCFKRKERDSSTLAEALEAFCLRAQAGVWRTWHLVWVCGCF